MHVNGIPSVVDAAVRAHMDAVDAACPGLLIGMHLTGSVALGDYHPGESDIDAVCVVEHALELTELDALRRIHDQHHGPHIDSLYVTLAELAEDPASASAPHAHQGRFSTDRAFDANPSVWRTLQLAPFPVRGGPAGGVWFDAQELMRWNRANLATYWRDWVSWLRQREPTLFRAIDRNGLPWLVLGVSRLHHTIETLGVTSKTGGGQWARARFDPGWHPIIDHALACRAGAPPREPYGPIDVLHADAADFAEMVIASGVDL
jgi:hypothetical protein